MNKILTAFVVAGVVWNLQFIGGEHMPLTVELTDESGAVIESASGWQKVGNVYNWEVFDAAGNSVQSISFQTINEPQIQEQ